MRGAAMRGAASSRAATAALLLVLTRALSPSGAVAQVRTPPAQPGDSRAAGENPFDRLLEHRPGLVVRPMVALLAGGASEPRLSAAVTWPGGDVVGDVTLQLLADLTLGGEAYSRSGLRLEVGEALGPARVAGAASVSRGSGAGPGQAIALALTAGVPTVGLEMRTTWLQGTSGRTVRTVVIDGSEPRLSSETFRHHGRYTDGEAYAGHRLGRVDLKVVGGQRFGGDPHGVPHWAFAEVDVPVWRRYGVVLSGGVRPERPDAGQQGGRFIQMGLRMHFRPSPPEPIPAPHVMPEQAAVVPLEEGRYLLRLHVPGARRVELQGDVTDWSIVAMRRSAAGIGLWETVLHKPAGVYHVNIRVDGGDWTAPPGLVAVPDRFGGTVGVLNLPPLEEENHEA